QHGSRRLDRRGCALRRARRWPAGRGRPGRPRAGAPDRHPLQRPAERGADRPRGRRDGRDQRRDDGDGRREHPGRLERRAAGRPLEPRGLGPPPGILKESATMPKVLITAPGARGDDDPRLKALREAGWDVKTYRWQGGRPDDEEVVELVQGYDAVIA